jgi:hypothetical protein
MTRSRVLLLAAIGGALLYLAGAIALGSAPGIDDSSAQVAAFLGDHADGVRTYAWTAALGTLAIAIFAGIVAGLLPSPSREIFLIGAAAFVVENAIQAWLWGAMALRPLTTDPATLRTLLDTAIFWGPVLTGATTTMIGAVTVLGLRSQPLIPRWLTALGAVAFIEQAIETITIFGTGGFIAPGGAMNVELGAGLTLIWLIGLTVWAVRGGDAVPRPGREPAAA